jgi:hypothetical protein
MTAQLLLVSSAMRCKLQKGKGKCGSGSTRSAPHPLSWLQRCLCEVTKIKGK